MDATATTPLKTGTSASTDFEINHRTEMNIGATANETHVVRRRGAAPAARRLVERGDTRVVIEHHPPVMGAVQCPVSTPARRAAARERKERAVARCFDRTFLPIR
jgi:hypothetical protein